MLHINVNKKKSLFNNQFLIIFKHGNETIILANFISLVKIT